MGPKSAHDTEGHPFLSQPASWYTRTWFDPLCCSLIWCQVHEVYPVLKLGYAFLGFTTWFHLFCHWHLLEQKGFSKWELDDPECPMGLLTSTAQLVTACFSLWWSRWEVGAEVSLQNVRTCWADLGHFSTFLIHRLPKRVIAVGLKDQYFWNMVSLSFHTIRLAGFQTCFYLELLGQVSHLYFIDKINRYNGNKMEQ